MGYHELAIIGIIIVIALFIIARYFQKKDSSGKAYSQHIKNLVDGIYSNTTLEGYIKQKTGQVSHTSGGIGDGLDDITDFAITIRSSPLKKDIVEHLKSYQEITKIPIYDDYKNSIIFQKEIEKIRNEPNLTLDVNLAVEITPEEREDNEIEKRYQLRTKFAEEFNTLRQKINSDSNPNFGKCADSCPNTFKTKFRKLKFCKSKQDNSLWDDETW